jgi:RND superfamily putative drug exporter
MTEQVQKDLERAELLTFPIVFVLLIVVFGSLVAASLPLFTGAFTILGGLLLLRVATTMTDMSVFAVNIITMLGLGLAIDYSLFVVSRFREELVRHDNDVQTALSRTMQTAGRTVVFSGLTVMIALMSLIIFPQMLMKSLGWGGSAAVLVAMLASVTVLPAALAVLGPRVNRLAVKSLLPARFRRGVAHPDNPEGGIWYRASSFVMRHAGLVLVVTVIPLALVGLPFLRIIISIPDHRGLPTGSESRQVGDMLVSDFPHNETTPIEIAVRSDKPALDPDSIAALFNYTRDIAALPGVRRVDSLVNLDPRLDTGGAQAYATFYSSRGNPQNPMAVQAEQAAGRLSRGNYSVVRVLFDSEMLSGESQQLVRSIRDMDPPGGLTAWVGGRTAELVDFVQSLQATVPLAIGLIVAVMFVLLFLMLGSVVVPLTAVVLNTLSLSASFGALVWIFQDGNLANLLGFTPMGSIDGTMPVLIFAIAFGLSMDYAVFLLSRIKEQHDRTGDTTQAVATGVQKTGGIITSAALLLVVVIGSFTMGEVLFMKQVGVGLALAILVDATLVRMVLVPATMRILGKYNWWAPRPLVALYERLGMGERDIDEAPRLRTEQPQPEKEQAGVGVS